MTWRVEWFTTFGWRSSGGLRHKGVFHKTQGLTRDEAISTALKLPDWFRYRIRRQP